jgi:seryl-tRNA synthetase
VTARLDTPGVIWRDEGQAVLTGDALVLFRALDRLWQGWASAAGATELAVPPMLPARALQRLDYFASFPHLATFACVHDPDAGNLAAFARHPWRDDDAGLALGALAPAQHVLTPAACYHVYHDMVGQDLAAPALFTLCAPCFRREEAYEPLRRQWVFHMREIVCVGTGDEVKAHLAAHRGALAALAARLGLATSFAHGTDPFFNPGRNARYLMQRVDPTKEELLHEGELAIASLNHHRDTMGKAFAIRRGGETAQTSCVAFGLERWLYALVHTHGLPGALRVVEAELAAAR